MGDGGESRSRVKGPVSGLGKRDESSEGVRRWGWWEEGRILLTLANSKVAVLFSEPPYSATLSRS